MANRRDELMRVMQLAAEKGIPVPGDVLLEIAKQDMGVLIAVSEKNMQALLEAGLVQMQNKISALPPFPDRFEAQAIDGIISPDNLPIFTLTRPGVVPPPERLGLMLSSSGWTKIPEPLTYVFSGKRGGGGGGGGGGGTPLPADAVGWLHNDGAGNLVWSNPPGGTGSVWYDGAGVPAAGLGNDGDYYLRSTNGNVYSKAGGVWSIVANIRGPAGANGTNGTNGTNGIDGADGADGAPGADGKSVLSGAGAPGAVGNLGDFYINTTTHEIYGPKTGGGWGSPTSLIGPAGADGADGTNGTNGTNGVDGKTVLSGAGAPAGGLGVVGDFYIDTTANAIYGPKSGGGWGSPTSLIGPAGADGADGAPGPNTVTTATTTDITGILKGDGANVGVANDIINTLDALADGSGVLTNDGAGVLSWEAPGGGGVDILQMQVFS